jgi:hypothetical protein
LLPNAENEYLSALTQKIDNPGKGILDKYLKSFVMTGIAEDQLAGHVKTVPGLSFLPTPLWGLGAAVWRGEHTASGSHAVFI